MSIADKYRPQYVYTDYLQWKGKWELIDGMPYAKSPAPNIRHQRISGNLYTLLQHAITKGCQKCEIYLPIDWKIDEKTVVQPDLLLLCNPVTEGQYIDTTPALVVEILSPSTALKDRREKYELYEQSGVKYYLIVDPQLNKMEVYKLFDGEYQPVAITPSQFSFTLEEGCELTADFTKAWD